MATLSTFRPCAYTSEADFEAIASLINTCHIADDIDIRTSVTEVREDYASPRFDIARDLRLWRDNTGDLVAIAECWHSPPQPNETKMVGSLYFDIHPRVRGAGLETTLMTWAKQRLQQAGQTTSLPLFLQSGCRDKLTERKQLLAQFGFTPERYFFQLKRSLQDPIVSLSAPAGWKIRTIDIEDDAQAWVDMFNQSFVDHWNHSPITVEDYRYYTTLSEYDPTLDLVIETPTGELVTFCYCSIDCDRNQRLGRQEGHVQLLGTRRGFRRQGLARTLLVAGLKHLQTRGMTIATIGVDSQNPSGAVALYKSVGFLEDYRSTIYRQEISREPQ